MECNKEEAIRAKGIAEKKMENKDFVAARRIALKAQQLYPYLENISQMIMVCDVHCSAENKVYGNENDWYGILKIEPTADETSIKKQYRKFALLLHPDKNKFAGATDAFKLIGEAQRVLLDREKRMLHDSKCKAAGISSAPNSAPKQASWQSNVGNPAWVQKNFTSNVTSQFPNKQCQPQQQPTQSGFYDNRPTFWTVCPFCYVRYQFYKDVLNKLLSCQNCGKSFIGYEINAQGATPGTNRSQPAFPQQKEVQNQGPSKVGQQNNFENYSSKVGFQGKVGSESTSTDSFVKKGSTSELGKGSKSNRSKRHVSYNENLRNDDYLMNPSKRGKCSGSFHATKEEVEDPSPKEEALNMNKPADLAADMDGKEVKQKEHSSYEESLQNGQNKTKKANEIGRASEDGKKNSEDTSESSSKSSSSVIEPETYECPDPDFSDFDKDRKEDCFAAGQIWAVYDTLDAMPRFYARIRKVFLPGFKLRITWLESVPDDEDEIKWVDKDLPVSCGKFRHATSENAEDHPMFSHLVYWEKGSGRDSIKIYPRKGETWALFKNWDIKWYSDPEGKKKYEYEFVEVLSDYADGVGTWVAYLSKVKGFKCLFCRTMKKGVDSIIIPLKEIFRFSHRVPSFQMTGEERKDVPKGSFELDPASLPTNLDESAVPENVKIEAGNMHPNGSCPRYPADAVEPMTKSEGNASVNQADQKTHLYSDLCLDKRTDDHGGPSTPEAYEIPEPEFYDFDADKSLEKFQIGQIWALYSDEDGLPKYYGQIKKINSPPKFELHITWLITCSTSKDMIQWTHKKMLTSCGRFKLIKGKSHVYTATASFSHQLRAETTDKKDVYAVFPRAGEVWALYKNWNAKMACSDLENCEYDMVEVLEENDSWIAVLVLELVDGFKSVFKAQMKGQSNLTMKIPRVELLRFSHQIPAFRLTEERGGILRGLWELDPAALPVSLFCTS